MKALRTALIALLALLCAQAAHAAAAGSGQSGLCSYTPVTTPLDSGACWPLNVNGVTKTITAAQFFKNAMQGPGASTIGHVPMFGDTGGLTLIDAGAPPTLLAQDMAALAAMPVAPLALGLRVRVGTYSVANRQFAPSVDYYLTTTVCTPDAGSCMQSANNASYYWHITPQTIWDPRWWGAYGDVQKKTLVTATSSGNSTVVVTNAGFVATDVGKLITITNIVSGGGAYNGPSYEGVITGWVSGNQITVSPSVGFTVNDTENVFYGHDDGATRVNQPTGPINAALTFVKSILAVQQLSGQPQLNGGGLSYGTSRQITMSNNAALFQTDIVALSSANLPIESSGVLAISCSFCTGFHVHVDAGYLPVNACYANTNGTIYWQDLRCNNWMGSRKTVTATGAHSMNATQFTASIGACSGTGPFNCVMTVTAVANGTIQPGQGLSDCVGGSGNNCGVHVPAGTYIDAFAPNNTGSGGIGAYTITNNTINPGVVASETMYGLSLDITVASCNTNNPPAVNGNLWPMDASGNLLVGVGEISHGNSLVGVADRTFIVGCASSTVAVLNKAPTFNFTGQSLTFTQDSNGFYMFGTAVGSNFNTGLQLLDLTISEDSTDYVTNINTKFGAALMDNSGGGTTIDKGAIAYGAAQIAFGPDSHNTIIKHMTTVSGQVGQVNEINQPAVISFDGGENIILDQMEFGGQMQFFAVNNGQRDVSITNSIIFLDGSRTNLAPDNTIWFYTEQTNTPSTRITVQAPQQNYNNPGNPAELIFTTGGGGTQSWSCLSAQQIAVFSQSMNVILPVYCSPTMFPGAGISLGTAPLSAAEYPYIPLSASYAAVETDSNALYDVIVNTNVDITLPNTLSNSSVNGPNNSSWHVKVSPRGSGTIRIVPASGVTLLTASGSTTSPVTLTQNLEYGIDCPRNTNVAATQPVCYLNKLTN